MLSDSQWIDYNKRKIKHLQACIDEAANSGNGSLIAEYCRELLKLQERYGSVNGNDSVGDSHA